MTSELNESLARLNLMRLNDQARGLPGPPILIEVSKAITLAELHRDIEARVVCTTVDDVVDAMLLLSTKLGSDRGKWSFLTKTLEMPNGSAVVLILDLPELRALDEAKGTP